MTEDRLIRHMEEFSARTKELKELQDYKKFHAEHSRQGRDERRRLDRIAKKRGWS